MATEDTQEQPTAQTEQATEQAGQQSENAAEQEVGWEVIEKALDKVPADQLRKHKRFAGILGGSLQSAREVWERDRKEQEQTAASERAHKELLDLAESDPIAFAEKYLSQAEADRLRKQVESMRADTAKQYMHQIGAAYGQAFSLTDDDIAQISTELQGKQDDEVLPTFNVAAAKIVTQREAQKLFNEWREKELPKERDALKQEVAAEMLKGGPSPSIRRGSPPSTIKPWQLSDKDFDAWYSENVLKPARTFNGR